MATERTDTTAAAGALPRRTAGERAGELARYLLRSWELYVFVLPAIIHVLLFRYLPIYGLRIAFTDGFSLRSGRSAPEWNEFAHFIRFFNSAYFIPVIRNTIVISLYSLATWPIPLALGLMINEARSRFFKKSVQRKRFTNIRSIYLLNPTSFNAIEKIFAELLRKHWSTIRRMLSQISSLAMIGVSTSLRVECSGPTKCFDDVEESPEEWLHVPREAVSNLLRGTLD